MEEVEGKEEKKYCCAIKQYFSKDVNLVDSLSISPRVILCKRPLQLQQVYEQTISVKNTGMYPRSIKCSTDATDTELKICNLKNYEYLQPSASFVIVVRVKPLSKQLINSCRNVYLESEHPNIKIQIPIIAYVKGADLLYPTSIELPSTIPTECTYFEFTIFNATKVLTPFTLRNSNADLTCRAECCKIKPNDFVRILLQLSVKNKEKTTGAIKIRYGVDNYNINYLHEPVCMALYLSTKHIQFEETKFERENKKQFTICNNTSISVPFRLNCSATMTHLEKMPSVIIRESQLHVSISEDSFLTEDVEEEQSAEDEHINPHQDIDNIIKNYSITPLEGVLSANSCTKIDVTFHPRFNTMVYDDNMTPPYACNFEMMLTSSDGDLGEDVYVVVEGAISGPEMFITPKAIDFRKVYLGEEHCEEIRITNIDGTVKTFVEFSDYTSPETAKVSIVPTEGVELGACETGEFTFSFFTVIVGKIYFKLRFKIKNGDFLIVVVKANSVPVRVKTFPDIVEFGTVPFAVPQKRTVLLMNPLSVPISMQCFMDDNGSEIPLVLNVDNVKELPPVIIRNPVENIIAAHNEDKISAYHLSDVTVCDNPEEEGDGFSEMFRSVTDDDNSTVCSVDFENEVMNIIPDLALEVVNVIKAKRFSEKNEPEAKIVSHVTDELINLPYFFDLKKYNNYARMDWNAIPSDPTEVYYDTEIINLRPNASRSFTILIIPNTVGYYNRAISVRCCPHISQAPECDMIRKHPYEMIVDSQLMVTKIWFEYNCRVPEISWNNEIILDGIQVYAMQPYNVDITFTNESTVGGFLHFVVLPFCKSGAMRFRNNVWKFYIPPEESQVAQGEVEFREINNVTLTGMVRIVGCCMGLPFHISANVLPLRISIFPKEIRRRQNVMEKTINYVYITNLTPTRTRLNIYLRNEHHQTIDPHGVQLAPTGQGTYVVITTMFPDPEVYKNTLYVDLLFGEIREVPLLFTVVGMPIFFDPDLPNGLDIGVVLLSSVTDYESRKSNISRLVRVWNTGERPYVVAFNRLKATKSGSNRCDADIVKANINIEPKSILLNPGEEKYISVTAVSCQEVLLQSEFRYVITDQINPKRVLSKSFSITAKFSHAELNWSRRNVRIKYNRTHIFKQKSQLEMVELINVTGTEIENVVLRVCGPFKIKVVYERPFSKEVQFNILANERKEITILLDESKLRHTTCSFMKGKIICFINQKAQKWLPLRIDINYPDIIIVDSDIVIFNANEENQTDVVLENVGLLDAEYTWKKLGECVRYVAEEDDYERFARDILSDIIRMLELHEADQRDTDSLCQRNETLCYQKYRCLLATLEDPDCIVDIIYDIIDKLDLENKRYKIQLDDDISEEADETTSKTYVKETVEQLLDRLKLEDSYEITEPSEEECNPNEHFHFFEKNGTVLASHGAYSLLHLPAVRKGHAHMASFLLDVVGGQPQKFFITLVNLDKIVEVCPESLYLGVRPWYELFKANIRVYNVTPFKANIHVKDVPRPKDPNRRPFYLSDGYACVVGSRIFLINPCCSHRIKTEGVFGFTSEFIREFKLSISDYSSSSFRLRGQGVMPILLATRTNLTRIEQNPCEIVEEYILLQRIYYFSMFKDITFVDEEMEASPPEEDKVCKSISFSQISILSASECSDDDDDTPLCRRIAHNWELLLGTYVVVFNNASLPNPTILEQLLNMEKFKDDLNYNFDKRSMLQRLYRDYTKFQSKCDPNMPINLKYFTVQPLPFEQLGYVINMSNLKLDQFRKYDIDLQFLGPGKLIAAARTAVKIPGLYVHFQVITHSGQEFLCYRSEEKMPDFFIKRYQNMWEREIDMEINPKLLHAHSFDCEDRCKLHKRCVTNITLKDRKDIKNYYNSLNKSVYLENKHHFINSIIYTTDKENFSGTIIRINIVIKPCSKYYCRGQCIEDFLFIDLHMGPTLPILLRGLIK